ncbi:hypothetical protein [Companilactobacillus zhongbaensis]|uniref:hypothetical protein n=1 Tax=Companilactobacillus zhongbaensis TaxID=2486009 RepID=UPI000F773836|nr:hypothetical protein [Companilactobacillus zhongbaensis]
MSAKSHQYRDLTITPITAEKDMVVSCDISAGFGDRKYDIVKCSPEISVSFTLRTAMLELISYGATPLNVVDTLSVEYNPTGISVIKQMQKDLADMGYSEVSINGSTEDNLDIQMTTVSVTVIGEAPHEKTRQINPATIFQLGRPLVGNEVLANLDHIFTVKDAIDLRKDPNVSDMIPVGSKGIEYEMSVLAASNGQTLQLETSVDQSQMKKTVGPSTVLLVVVEDQNLIDFKKDHPELIKIAKLR